MVEDMVVHKPASAPRRGGRSGCLTILAGQQDTPCLFWLFVAHATWIPPSGGCRDILRV